MAAFASAVLEVCSDRVGDDAVAIEIRCRYSERVRETTAGCGSTSTGGHRAAREQSVAALAASLAQETDATLRDVLGLPDATRGMEILSALS